MGINYKGIYYDGINQLGHGITMAIMGSMGKPDSKLPTTLETLGL